MSLGPPSSQASGSIPAEVYVSALADHIRKHESAYAAFVTRAPVRTTPSWTTYLSLGVLSSDVALPPLPKLVLSLSAHHLYFLLLKFEELGVPNLGPLDAHVELSAPMIAPYGPPARGDRSDAISLRSAFSDFSIGSGWWGSGKKRPDAREDVKSVYSAFTKLPAIRLQPFAKSSGSKTAPLNKAVAEFEDCPPQQTAIPLYAFKNLQSLAMDRLDPRGFVGWDVLATQLRSLEISQSGLEDLGELICDAVVDDFKRKTSDGVNGNDLAEERRERRRNATGASTPARDQTPPPTSDEPCPAHAQETSVSSYPVPPRSAWHQLRHLSLSDNSLTFIPTTPLTHLPALTSLDLSSNLLIAIPTGLAHLSSLRFLNLSDNMIDSLAGIAKSLGNVSVINLSKNRLENLSGLDRLYALERVDLRENRISEALEISRLAQLPCLKEVYIERNPFSRAVAEGGEESYRVKCFGYFAQEGKSDVKLDGSEPGMSERRGLEVNGRGSPGMFNGRRASFGAGRGPSEEALYAGQAKIVGRRAVTNPVPRSRQPTPDVPPVPALPPNARDATASATKPAQGESDSAPERLSSPSNASPSKPKRRKPRRIVDLDGGTLLPGESAQTDSDPSQNHARFSSSPTPASPIAGEAGSSSFSLPGTKVSRRAGSAEPPKGREESLAGGGDALRRKIEALRDEVGESWLAVLGEREDRAERTKSQSEGESSDAKKHSAKVDEAQKVPVGEEPAREGEAGQVAVVVVGSKKKAKKKKNGSNGGAH